MKLFLLIRLGQDLFGVDAGDVMEVAESSSLHYIPRGGPFFLGAVNLHGQILPVLDLARFLGLSDRQRDGRIVALRTDRGLLALSVPTVLRTTFLDGDGIVPHQSRGEAIDNYINGVYCDEEKTVYLLETAFLFKKIEAVLQATGGDDGA